MNIPMNTSLTSISPVEAAPARGRPPIAPLAWALALVLGLSACGGGGGDGEVAQPLAAMPSVGALAIPEPVGQHCAAGGARIDTGIDSNANGVLDVAEITGTQYVCNGSVGATGAAGANGTAGQNGLTMLMRLDVEPAGAHCAAGGTKVSVGLDANANGVLDAGEISGTPGYVCGGVPGVAGTHGVDGTNGTNGTNGTAGASGQSSLMAMAVEAAGANCQYGGTKVTAGLDANANAVLDAGEVTATSYNCNGAPGAGISWVNVSGTSQQASAGIGYLANNSAQVTITLPASPNIGDLIEVSGAGAGGWVIAQNASQSIVTKALPANYANYGASWTPQAAAGSRAWSGVAASADASKLVAVANGDRIYTSTNAGLSWTARDSNRAWWAVASSADGSKLVALAWPGQIYTSTDSGVSWTARDSVRNWYSVASSSDGSKLVAAEGGAGHIYTSTDSGVTWTARDSNRDWGGVASSADGSKLAALASNGQIYTSTDSGVSWTARESNRNWAVVASSADGSKLVACDYGGQIYTSTDSGVTWTARESNRDWSGVASSSDGSKLVAVDGSNGQIYTSLTDRTTPGVSGSLTGSQYDAIELQYIGGNLWMPKSASSYSGSFTVH